MVALPVDEAVLRALSDEAAQEQRAAAEPSGRQVARGRTLRRPFWRRPRETRPIRRRPWRSAILGMLHESAELAR